MANLSIRSISSPAIPTAESSDAMPSPRNAVAEEWWGTGWWFDEADQRFYLRYNLIPAIVATTDELPVTFTVVDSEGHSSSTNVIFRLNAYPVAVPRNYEFTITPGHRSMLTWPRRPEWRPGRMGGHAKR